MNESKFIPEDKKTFTALDILEMEGFQDNLKLTLVLYDFDLIPEALCNEFACRCAERALGKIKDPDPRIVGAHSPQTYGVGGEMTDAELQSAWDAAYGAVQDTARANSIDALYAAMDSAIINARDSAWKASWHAAFSATDWKAERTWQMEEFKKLLKEAQP